MSRMNPELGALYNDHMNQAHTGEARYSTQERHARVRSLLDRGLLQEGIDLYHAGLVIAGGARPNALRETYDLFMQAAERGYPGARAHAALKYDLWLRSQGQPQRFGSFWRWEGDEPVPEPFADPDAVASLRAAWGLPTLAEEAQRRRERRERLRNPARRGGSNTRRTCDRDRLAASGDKPARSPRYDRYRAAMVHRRFFADRPGAYGGHDDALLIVRVLHSKHWH